MIGAMESAVCLMALRLRWLQRSRSPLQPRLLVHDLALHSPPSYPTELVSVGYGSEESSICPAYSISRELCCRGGRYDLDGPGLAWGCSRARLAAARQALEERVPSQLSTQRWFLSITQGLLMEGSELVSGSAEYPMGWSDSCVGQMGSGLRTHYQNTAAPWWRVEARKISC